MACRAAQTADGKATFIICGLPVTKKCNWCEKDGLYLCDWPKMERAHFVVRKLRVGQIILRGTITDPVSWKLVAIAPYDSDTGLLVEIKYFDSKFGRECSVVEPRDKTLGGWRRGSCSLAMCETHAREIGPEKHYCREHWDAWQTAEQNVDTQMALTLGEEPA